MAAKEPTVEPRQGALEALVGIAFADESSKKAAAWLVEKAITAAAERAWDEGKEAHAAWVRGALSLPAVNPYRLPKGPTK